MNKNKKKTISKTELWEVIGQNKYGEQITCTVRASNPIMATKKAIKYKDSYEEPIRLSRINEVKFIARED